MKKASVEHNTLTSFRLIASFLIIAFLFCLSGCSKDYSQYNDIFTKNVSCSSAMLWSDETNKKSISCSFKMNNDGTWSLKVTSYPEESFRGKWKITDVKKSSGQKDSTKIQGSLYMGNSTTKSGAFKYDSLYAKNSSLPGPNGSTVHTFPYYSVELNLENGERITFDCYSSK